MACLLDMAVWFERLLKFFFVAHTRCKPHFGHWPKYLFMCVILVPRRPAPLGYHLVPTKRSAAFPNENVFAYESAGHVVYREYRILITGRVVVHFARVVESFTCAPADISFKGKSFFFLR